MPDAQMQKERKIIEIYKAAREKKLPSDVFIERYGKQINQAFKKGEISSDQIVSLCLSLSAEHGPEALKRMFARAEDMQHMADDVILEVVKPLVSWGDYSKSKVEYGNGVKVSFSNSSKPLPWVPERITFEATASHGSVALEWKFGGSKAKKG